MESKERLKNLVHSRLLREKKSATEIQEVLESLKVRPLSYADYQAMPRDVASWHEWANSAHVDKALQAHQDEKEKATQKANSEISRMWNYTATDEEQEAARTAAETFSQPV